MRPGTKLLLLGSLYLAQGLPYGFFTQALPVLLREQDLSLPLIGLAHLLSLPWALKFAWAPLVDRASRRAVIVPLQLAACAVMLGLAFAASPEALWALSIAVLAVNLISATQDIATDGLAVEILTLEERGLANGLQVGAYRAGMVVGGGVVLWIFWTSGWTIAFVVMAAVLAATTLPIALYRSGPPAPRVPGPNLAAIRESAGRLGSWVWVLVTFKTGEWFAAGMMRTFLKDSGQTLGDLATMLGFAGFSAAFVGAIAGGALTSALGRRRALILFGSLQSLAIASIALAVRWPSDAAFYAVMIAEHLTSGMATAALFTAMMDRSRITHAGTDYTVQASIVVIATGLASMLSGVSAELIGYGPHFMVAAGMSAAAVVVAAQIRDDGR
jgi:PAT family beta-lactamase induction signal transducer AmpG